MINKSIKKIGLFCLCLTSLSLAGCFHVPDEDWLPSRNKVKTENVKQENVEVEQAINSLVDGFNMISSEWDEMKNNEESEEITGNENIYIEGTTENVVNNEEIINVDDENQENIAE